jgi:hypothetical protein
MSDGTSELRNAIMKSFSNPNPESHGIFRMIDEVYPAFAKKIFQNNDFMKQIVMSGYSPLHILDYPICDRCETFAAFSGFGKKNGKIVNVCKCFGKGCGATTVDPITFRQWLIMELKKKAPASFADNIEFAVDAAAQGMVQKYIREAKENYTKGGKPQNSGILDMYGNPTAPEHFEVTQERTTSKVDLKEEARKIGREEHCDVCEID